jgi:hypothetical protein
LLGLRGPTAIAVLLISSVPLSFLINALICLIVLNPLELVPKKDPGKNKLQRHLTRFNRNCPACGEVILPAQVPVWQSHGFPCPACNQILKSSNPPVRLNLSVTFAVSLVLSVSYGLRGFNLILVSLIASVPLYFIVNAIVALIRPPGLELVSKRYDRLDKY